MSMFRAILAAAAALAIAAPALADDTTNTTTSTDTSMTQTTTDQTATDQTTKIDLNKATVKQLMSVKGISASKAKAIVTYRKKHGDFKTLDDLTQVKGFKNLKSDQLKDIQDQLSIE